MNNKKQNMKENAKYDILDFCRCWKILNINKWHDNNFTLWLYVHCHEDHHVYISETFLYVSNLIWKN